MISGKLKHIESREKFHSFEELFHLYYPRSLRYATYFLKDQAEAEDLVQDVFFQIWESRIQLDQQKNISAFIFTRLKNRCLNTLKRRLVEEKYKDFHINFEAEELYNISMNEQGEFVSMDELLKQELEKVISEMPRKCAQVFTSRWIDGKKIKEIAVELDISTTMVDKHLARGLEIAKSKLNPELFLLFLFSP